MKVLELKKYKNSLHEGLSRDLSDFEKNFLLISAGTFTFSITFIKDIVKLENADFLFLLFIGWLMIGTATGVIMFAFLYSVNAANQLWKHVDDFLIINKKFNETDDLTDIESDKIKRETNDILYYSKNVLKKFRYLAVTCFLIGIACLAIFIGVNIIKENQVKYIKKLVREQKKPTEKKIILNLKEYQIISNDSLFILNQIESQNGKKQKSRKHQGRRNKEIICCYTSRARDTNTFHRVREAHVCKCDSYRNNGDTCQTFRKHYWK